MRDVRIHPIHEGTTGIQGMDLLGRKVRCIKVSDDDLPGGGRQGDRRRPGSRRAQAVRDKLATAIEILKQVTSALVGIAMKGEVDKFLSDATLYLELSGIICIAWQWLLQGIAVQKALPKQRPAKRRDFYEGKLFAMKFFLSTSCPKSRPAYQAHEHGRDNVAMRPNHFTD